MDASTERAALVHVDVVHSSTFDTARIMCRPGDPCGLWQSAPSSAFTKRHVRRMRQLRATVMVALHALGRHVPGGEKLLAPGSWGSCTLWQSRQATLFRACALCGNRIARGAVAAHADRVRVTGFIVLNSGSSGTPDRPRSPQRRVQGARAVARFTLDHLSGFMASTRAP